MTSSPEPAALLLRPEEAAKIIAVGRTRIFDLMRTGELRSVTVNSSRRIRRADLEAYVESLGRPEAA